MRVEGGGSQSGEGGPKGRTALQSQRCIIAIVAFASLGPSRAVRPHPAHEKRPWPLISHVPPDPSALPGPNFADWASPPLPASRGCRGALPVSSY